MYWICWTPNDRERDPAAPQAKGPRLALVRRLGFAFFLVLIGVQATLGLADLAFAAIVGTPESRSRDFADLVSRRPDLKDAILIGEPDYMLEPMHYYLSNPTYFVREKHYGEHVHFTRKARLDLTLGNSSTRRAPSTLPGRPVRLCSPGVWTMDSTRVYRESYVWTFSAPAIRSSDSRGDDAAGAIPQSDQRRKL